MKQAMTVLALIHLSLVAAGAAHLHVGARFEGVDEAVRAYGEFSGANNNYGFFAPAVASEIKARFLITHADGHVTADSLEQTSGEVNLRIHTMFSFFSMEESQDLLARSWAATMFSRYPDASVVRVSVSVYELPSMRQYRMNRAPRWREFYTARFARAADAPATGRAA